MAFSEIAAWVGLVLALVLGILCFALNSRLGTIERQYKALMRGSSSSSGHSLSIGEALSSQGERLEATRTDLTALQQKVGGMDVLLTRSVQHVGLVRYNPFQDTGGDQSFALALLDKRGDGVVVSSLHSRTMTRFYAKPIKSGASTTSLSEEEVQALQQALGTQSPKT
jgi:hypothetical protein